MRKLDKPIDDSEDVYLKCISKVRNTDLKTRLTDVSHHVASSAEKYETAAADANLHTLAAADFTCTDVSKSELTKVYTQRMVPKKAPGHRYYDKLITSSPHGICPLCGHRTVSTLDHCLPKAHFPTLAVVPSNLVPACKDCNSNKTDIVPQNSDEQALNPYFDDVDDGLWLQARVVEKHPPTLEFYVASPEGWNVTKIKRVCYHFEVLALASLYAANAAAELMGISGYLKNLFQSKGNSGVRYHLSEMAESHAIAHINSWKTAMYKALADSDWYCNEGVCF